MSVADKEASKPMGMYVRSHLGGSARSSAHWTLVRLIRIAGRMVFFSSSMADLPLPGNSSENEAAAAALVGNFDHLPLDFTCVL